MASANQQQHPNYSRQPYNPNLAHIGKGGPTNTNRENRLDRDRMAQSQAPSSNPMNNISEEQRDEINEAFSLFDLDKDQRIDYHEFKVALKALGFDMSKTELHNMLTVYGTPIKNQAQGLGKSTQISPTRMCLTLHSFQNIAAKLIADRDPQEEILRAFALFDTENKGMITLGDLRRVAQELGEGLEEDELAAMIEEFDLEGKGGVGQEEFISICMGN